MPRRPAAVPSVNNLCESEPALSGAEGTNKKGGEGPSANNLCESEPALSGAEGANKKRGGRRPGAGAKPGNLNALKHGLRSRQFAELGLLLASIPEARHTLLALARRHQLKQRRAEEVATLLLSRIVERARQIQETRSNVQSPIPERRSINPNAPQTDPAPIQPAPATENLGAAPSTAEYTGPRTIDSQIRKPP